MTSVEGPQPLPATIRPIRKARMKVTSSQQNAIDMKAEATDGAIEPVELVAGRLHRLGSTVQLDGRVSWAPKEARGYQPINSYLVNDPEALTLVDTGLTVHEPQVLAQLRKLNPTKRPMAIFMTRADYDCFGNLSAVVQGFEVTDLYTGGASNPFDAFDEVAGRAMTEKWSRAIRLGQGAGGDSPPIGKSDLDTITPSLRTLTTFWAYHRTTKTLFTSDVFSHSSVLDPGDSPVIDDSLTDLSTEESVQDQSASQVLLVEVGEYAPIVEQLDRLFKTREVEIIAPGRGCVLLGRSVVDRHWRLLRRVLMDVN